MAGSVQHRSNPGKVTPPTRQHELDHTDLTDHTDHTEHTDHTDQESICPGRRGVHGERYLVPAVFLFARFFFSGNFHSPLVLL